MTERSHTMLLLGTLSSAVYVPTQCFLSLAVERSWQSPPSTPVPWDLLRAVSGKFFQSVWNCCQSPRGITNIHLPCCNTLDNLPQPLLAGVGEPEFPSNQEEKVTYEMMESKGNWNCCPNRAFILVCPIPQGAGPWELRMCSLCILAHRHFTRHSWEPPSVPNPCFQIPAERRHPLNLLAGWTGRVMTAFHYFCWVALMSALRRLSWRNLLQKVTWIQELDAAG